MFSAYLSVFQTAKLFVYLFLSRKTQNAQKSVYTKRFFSPNFYYHP